ncbi:unnamed protein product, partial [marine sediment metagenome]
SPEQAFLNNTPCHVPGNLDTIAGETNPKPAFLYKHLWGIKGCRDINAVETSTGYAEPASTYGASPARVTY